MDVIVSNVEDNVNRFGFDRVSSGTKDLTALLPPLFCFAFSSEPGSVNRFSTIWKNCCSASAVKSTPGSSTSAADAVLSDDVVSTVRVALHEQSM